MARQLSKEGCSHYAECSGDIDHDRKQSVQDDTAEPILEKDRSYVVVGFILSAVSGFIMGLLAHWLF
jgi:anti-anti-sigma regulatory factor